MKLTKQQEQYIYEKLKRLKTSRFRSSFHLRKYMFYYIEQKGMEVIERHCHDFVEKNLNQIDLEKDGHQTPMKGHPVFIAQHATATCCRGCLEKWYNIPKDRKLTEKEFKFIEAIILSWIDNEIKNRK